MAKLINFAAGPVHCRSCGARMRPSEGITNGWPLASVPYGSAGACQGCVSQTPVSEPEPTEARVPSWRRRRPRFDYVPSTHLCPACNRLIDPTTGECRCSD